MSVSRHGRRKNLRELRAVYSVCFAEALERRILFSTFTVTTLTDGTGAGTLRTAITSANTAGGTDLINFSGGLSGTIDLGSSLPALNANITIDGPGATALTVNGQSHGSVFSINSGKTVSIENLTITGGSGTFTNGSDYGGGIFNEGSLTITDSTISGNTAAGTDGGGGGIFSQGAFGGASVVVVDSTISGNSASLFGGGILQNYGSVAVTNSTIQGNITQMGGGFLGRGVETFTDSTISGNTATVLTGGMYIDEGTVGTFSTTVNGTIIAGNVGGDFANTGTDTPTGSHDLIGDGSDNYAFNGSLRGTTGDPLNPKLGVLAGNGGSTSTMALLADSPALGTGATFSGVTTDQRGDARPAGSGVDIGAYQTPTLLVNTLTDPATPTGGILSLREAITDANTLGGTEEIGFASGLSGSIDVASELPAFTANIVIAGPGANVLTVNGEGHDTVFRNNFGVTAEIEGLTVTGGAGTIDFGVNNGGGISNFGDLVVSDCTISGNTVTGAFASGGGIYSKYSAGALTVADCTISGNSANYGGGISCDYGSLTVTDSTITGNSASSLGGGIYGRGAMTIADSTITGNSCSSTGGVLLGSGTNAPFTLTLDGSIVAANTGGDFGNSENTNIISGSNDLIGDGSDNDAFTNSLRGTSGSPLNPDLGALANNGGTTETIALLAGSPAIGTGGSFDGITADQRGDARPTGPGSDIGAYQVTTLVVNTLTDPSTPVSGLVSLREAIGVANTFGGTQEITFVSGLTGTIDLASVLPGFSANITIAGPGANVLAVNAQNHGSVFSINSGVTATIEGLTITGGNGTTSGPITEGGGIDNHGNLTVTDSTISGNTANGGLGFGGAIYGESGTTTVIDSTISGNTASVVGGGIAQNYGTLTVTDSTITGNSCSSGDGGGAYGRGVLTFTDDTISRNTAAVDGGLSVGSGSDGPFSTTIDGTIIAANTGGDFFNGGVAATGSHDLIGDGSDNGVFTSSLRGTVANPLNPLLGALAFNGGTTETDALLPGSPALGTGASFGGVTADQRGDPRPATGIDIGAYQVQALVVNTLGDPSSFTAGTLSLRQAITEADTLGGTQEITFAPGLTGIINLASVLPAITTNLDIDGPGAGVLTVDGPSLGSVFTINPGIDAEINDLTISGGGITNNGSLITEGNVVTGRITGSGGLTVGDGFAARLTISTNTGTSTVTSLIVNTNASLDISNNTLKINYGGAADPISSIVADLSAGFAGGAWTGTGIVSSVAAANHAGTPSDSVGYADSAADGADAVPIPGLGNASADDIIIRYTEAGDANMDGRVNFTDFSILIANYGKTGTDWAHGNFLYGPGTNFNDFSKVVANYGLVLSPVGSSAETLGGTTETLTTESAVTPQATATTLIAKKTSTAPGNNYSAPTSPQSTPASSDADGQVLDSDFTNLSGE